MRHLLSGVVMVVLVSGCGMLPPPEVEGTSEAGALPDREKPAPAPALAENIKLPEASSAKVLDKAAANGILLTVTSKGQVLLAPADREGDNDTLDNAAQVEGYLKRRIAAKNLKPKRDQLDANLVLRIDQETPFGKVFPILNAAYLVGFKQVQLRTVRSADSTEGQLTLTLPVRVEGGVSTIPDITAEQPKKWVVRITANDAGQIARMALREEGSAADGGENLGSDLTVYRKKLQGLADMELKRIRTAAAKGTKIPLPRVRVEIADKLLQTYVVGLLDGGIEAGFTEVLLVPIGWRGEGEEPEKDLTNEDPGLQSNLEAALPNIERVDKKTIDAALDKEFPQFSESKPNVPVGTETSYANRSGATKAKLLKEFGGTEESERAVALGLAWLARQQKQDGGWEYDIGDKGERIAATGMALLPFLAAGETHLKGKKYEKTVQAGLNYLVKNCPLEGTNKGRLSGNMYAHAIGALALCDAYGMTKDKNLLAPAQAAINYIVKAQAANGSWGYSPGNPGDTSIVGWQIQALKAARLGKDIVVPEATFKKAIDFLNFASAGARKGIYGYNDDAGAAPGTALTAVGLLSRYSIDGWGPDNAGMVEGVVGLMKKAPVKAAKTPEMYFNYYATQVVRNYGGDEWKTWNEGAKDDDGTRKGGMRDWLVSIQIKKDGANQGSFDPDTGWIGRGCGRVGTTAMCLLTLEVYYRHLPQDKRGKE